MYLVNFYLGVTQIQQSSLLVLIQSWNRHTIRANVNKPAIRMSTAGCVTTQHLSSLHITHR